MKGSDVYPNIHWDIGTAYDFFVSLVVLHRPTDFGVRSAWAAGMRQRLPTRDREALEAYQDCVVISPPLQWLHSLPDPKDSLTMLKVVKDLPPVERMNVLIGLTEAEPVLKDLVKKVCISGEWKDVDLDELKAYYKGKNKSKSIGDLTKKLDIWAEARDFGNQLLHALQSYYEAFFADDEHRILPALRDSLAKAQQFAQHHELPELFEELSQGVRYSAERFQGVDDLILAPSFWASPFIFFSSSLPLIILFGARPESASLVPGELVPDSLTVSLSALSDPTRLRILRYLSSESLTPTQLATRLRLRTPTVIHHLKVLRTAGLIYLSPGPQKKETHYQTRTERLNMICEMLKEFISGQDE
ncbi:MAG: winged helix-turn-helix domain-containing protein [Anaerolineales bacterium]